MTPAQEAKEYAAANGFTIRLSGRRYIIEHSDSQYEGYVADVGGYPAALNAMQKFVSERELADMSASDTATFNNPNDAKMMHCDVVREDGALGVFADAVVGGCPCAPCGDGSDVKCPNPVTGKLGCDADVADFADAVVAGGNYALYGLERFTDETDAQLERRVSQCRQLHFSDGSNLDAIGEGLSLEPRQPGETDANYRQYLMVGTRVHSFNDLLPAQQSAASAPKNSESKPWRLYGDSYELARFGTRVEAVKESRRFYNEALRTGMGTPHRSIRYVGA